MVYDNIRDLTPETKPYYQVLIDNRDFPYMVCALSNHVATSLSLCTCIYQYVGFFIFSSVVILRASHS